MCKQLMNRAPQKSKLLRNPRRAERVSDRSQDSIETRRVMIDNKRELVHIFLALSFLTTQHSTQFAEKR